MKKLKIYRALRNVLAAAAVLSVAASGKAQTWINTTIDPLHDGQGIMIWAYYNSGQSYDTFKTYGDMNFQTVLHGVLFSGAFAGNATALTNVPTTSFLAYTNTTPPASTNAPVGWFSVTDTNGITYRVALYR